MDQTGKEAKISYIGESSTILQQDRVFNRRISQIYLKPFGHHLLEELERRDKNPPIPIFIEKYGADNAKQAARDSVISLVRLGGLQAQYEIPEKKNM